jgi:A/G-specific adenine glycosylase
VAQREGDPERYPVKTRKLKRSAQSLWLLWLQTADGAVWLARRPTPGVWAGLYCLPVFESHADLLAAVPARQRAQARDLPAFSHVLTHKDLHLHPVALQLVAAELENGPQDGAWFAADQWPRLGLPAPIRKLLARG